jgi:hypothetical protein
MTSRNNVTVTYPPPNSCIPSRAKIRMKRKRTNSSEMMAFMLLIMEMTRFLSDGQYLSTNRIDVVTVT